MKDKEAPLIGSFFYIENLIKICYNKKYNKKGVWFMERLRLEELQVQSCVEVTMPESIGGGTI